MSELDPNAHTGEWTKTIGVAVVPVVVVALVLKALFCSAKGRAVNDTDAPELEEFATDGGRTAKRVDSVRVKAGRYVSAQPCVAALEDGDGDGAWGGRAKNVARGAKKAKAKPTPKPTRIKRGGSPARRPI